MKAVPWSGEIGLKEQAVVARHDRAIFKLFASQLSARFDRGIDGDQDYLICMNFPYEVVELEFEDDSKMRFEYAFLVEGDEYYGVFTEHCGYHCILRASIVEAKIVYPDRRKKPKFLKKKEPG